MASWFRKELPVDGRITFKCIFGEQYAVIGSGAEVSDQNGIGYPKEGSIDGYLTAVEGPIRFLPLPDEGILSPDEIKKLVIRSGSVKNQSYFPLTTSIFSDFD